MDNQTYKRMRPTHHHDCKACRFVGCVMESNGDTLDCWVCTGSGRSVILRHGSDGPDYASMPVSFLEGLDDEMGVYGTVPTKYVTSGQRILMKWAVENARKAGYLPRPSDPVREALQNVVDAYDGPELGMAEAFRRVAHVARLALTATQGA